MTLHFQICKGRRPRNQRFNARQQPRRPQRRDVAVPQRGVRDQREIEDEHGDLRLRGGRYGSLYRITPMVDSQLVNNRPRNQFMRRSRLSILRSTASKRAAVFFSEFSI